MTIKTLALLLVGFAAAAQVTTIVEQQVRLRSASTPGFVLTVAADGVSIVPQAVPAPAAAYVIGTPETPGCVAAPDGTYRLPRHVSAVAVWRNGLRASTAGEFTLSGGDTVTFAAPIPDEVVLCDYTY